MNLPGNTDSVSILIVMTSALGIFFYHYHFHIQKIPRILTGIRDEGTPDCNLGYYDTYDLLITISKKGMELDPENEIKSYWTELVFDNNVAGLLFLLVSSLVLISLTPIFSLSYSLPYLENFQDFDWNL